jgi:hypothetical protein
MVVRPRPRRQEARELGGLRGLQAALEQLWRERLDLDDRLAADVGQDERLIVVAAGPLGGGDDRRGRVLAELGSTGPSEACGSMTISSAASAIRVPPLIA